MMVASSLSDRARTSRGVASLALGLLSAPALGQVIKIDARGVATTYSGPTLFNGEVAQSLAPAVVPFSVVDTPFAEIAAEALAQGLDPALLQAVAWQESRGSMKALSPKGAIGIMQLMPGTAAALGVDPHDALQNVRGGARFLKSQINRFGSVELGLAAYNADPGAVASHGGIPPYRETRDYVARIVTRWRQAATPHLPVPVSFEVP